MSQYIEDNNTVSILKYPYALLRPVYEKTYIHTGVIDELADEDLKHAYTVCRNITRTHAKTFYLATRFLPYVKQRSIFAIYALCRYLDDLVDETEDLITNHKVSKTAIFDIIHKFKKDLSDAYNDEPGGNPILFAFSHTLKSYHIPIEYPYELMEGICMDLEKNRYANFQELYDYSYKVASIVGLMTNEVFGYSNEKAKVHAVELGIAMQLTNILRDIGDDLKRNRIYLPQDELKQFGLDENDLFSHCDDKRFTDLMDFQIQRARTYYISSDSGIPMLNADSRLPVYLARYNYSRILDVIETNKYQVYRRRAHLNMRQKLSILPKVWLNSFFS